jgi:hypothetical protein
MKGRFVKGRFEAIGGKRSRHLYEENHENRHSVLVSVLAKIRTERFPCTVLDRYCNTALVCANVYERDDMYWQ